MLGGLAMTVAYIAGFALTPVTDALDLKHTNVRIVSPMRTMTAKELASARMNGWAIAASTENLHATLPV